jgi:hypothetical protein
MIDDGKYMGKHVLMGITYVDAEDQVVEQVQRHGKIIRIDESGIFVEQADGEIFSLPPDIESLRPAEPRAYRLRSTGEAVENPDFLSTWTVHAPQSRNSE